MAVDTRRGEDLGEAVEELEGRETQRGPACGVGLGQDVEDLVGTAIDEAEAFESEGRPGAIPEEAFEAVAVGGLDANTPIQTESPAVIPAEHILDLVGFQEAVTANVPQHPLSHGVLEVLPELRCEGRGFVEAEAGGGSGLVLTRIILDLLEEPVDHAQVEMVVGVQK
jgi:hypothetical protein